MRRRKTQAWIDPDFKRALKIKAAEKGKHLLDLRMEDLTINKKKKNKDPFRFSI